MELHFRFCARINAPKANEHADSAHIFRARFCSEPCDENETKSFRFVL